MREGLTSLSLLIAWSLFPVGLHAEKAPLDIRSWEAVVADFVTAPAKQGVGGGGDGARLKELDTHRAIAFLTPFLSRGQPRELRLRAIHALGEAALQEAVPALSALARDPQEDIVMRKHALDPGLRYMKQSLAVQAAATLIADPASEIRHSAYLVLGQHDTDEAVMLLAERLRVVDDDLERTELLRALHLSNHPQVGQIVFERCPATFVEPYHFYASIMERFRVVAAQDVMLQQARILQRQFEAETMLSEDTLGLADIVLRYFGWFPREDVMPLFFSTVNRSEFGSHLRETAEQFITSPVVNPASKEKLSVLIKAGVLRNLDQMDD